MVRSSLMWVSQSEKYGQVQLIVGYSQSENYDQVQLVVAAFVSESLCEKG